MTANATDLDMSGCGMNDYVTKPSTAEARRDPSSLAAVIAAPGAAAVSTHPN